ncbi:MAG: carboxylesterase family protein [Terracidiphilus sp.]|jgi:para-nitrobenzyl esterase
MKQFTRRTLLRCSGMAAASLALQTRGIAWAQSALPAPLATTTTGKVSGLIADGVNVFKGIPYGGDTAKTRFKSPAPPAPWSGVKECFRFAAMAPQLTMARAASGAAPRVAQDQNVQSEDCLHLNVWTSGLRDHRKRPVLVYFHGGAYNNGTVNNDLYDGTRLVHRGDVVVVTVNHRLNAFGYLYLGDLAPEYAESGNAGQIDLVLALKWVRDNIAEFGGDPSRVLIFGQSGGGAKCATLMAAPAAKGLFHRVMTMSGQQIKGASIEIAASRAKTVLEKMGVTPGKNLAAQLNALTMEQLQSGAAAVNADWLPVVDHVILPRNPFDPDAPALSERVPMILGNTHDETSVAGHGPIAWETAPAVLQASVGEYLGPYTAEQIVAKYRELYPNYTPEQVDTAAATAFRAWPGQRWEAERRAANPKSQPHTWVYQMNFPGANGKAMHTIDIPFMFDNIAMAEAQIGSAPEQLAAANALAATMSEMLITYARTGNPNFAGLPYWPAYDLKNRSTMIWERTPHIENNPRGAERVFADKSHYHQAGTPLP